MGNTRWKTGPGPKSHTKGVHKKGPKAVHTIPLIRRALAPSTGPAQPHRVSRRAVAMPSAHSHKCPVPWEMSLSVTGSALDIISYPR